MGRKTMTYSKEELTRPSNYIVVVCDSNIDTHIIDNEEAEKYVQAYDRRALIITDKEVFKNSDIQKIKYLFISNATTSAVKLIDPSGASFKSVYEHLQNKFKNGLIIAHPETITHEIADNLAQNKVNGLDFIVYRQDLMGISGNERMRMNYLRIHYNPEFQFTKEYFNNFSEVYGMNSAIGIFTCQYIANTQYNICEAYVKENSEQYDKDGVKDYVDYYQLNKQFAYHVYYDFSTNKILEFSGEKIKYYMELMFKAISNKPLENRVDELCNIYATE